MSEAQGHRHPKGDCELADFNLEYSSYAHARWNTRTPSKEVSREVEKLGEALHELSSHLPPLLSRSDNAHQAYEKVVAAFAALSEASK
jgi:hypothetical protein